MRGCKSLSNEHDGNVRQRKEALKRKNTSKHHKHHGKSKSADEDNSERVSFKKIHKSKDLHSRNEFLSNKNHCTKPVSTNSKRKTSHDSHLLFKSHFSNGSLERYVDSNVDRQKPCQATSKKHTHHFDLHRQFHTVPVKDTASVPSVLENDHPYLIMKSQKCHSTTLVQDDLPDTNSLHKFKKFCNRLFKKWHTKEQTSEDSSSCDEANEFYCHPMKVKDIINLRAGLAVMGREEVVLEFEKLPVTPLHSMTVAEKPVNKAKNRFHSIQPYDNSRVQLELIDNDPDTDYINASFIDGERENMFIASQAPTSQTVADFWRMIWTYRIGKIVMITRLRENGKNKCEQYWPSKGCSEVFGDFFVSTTSETEYFDFVVRKFEVSKRKASKSLHVTQYHFLNWVDHSVPSPMTILDLRQKFRMEMDAEVDKYILVHCTAGVGRTGTFIALDSLLELGKQYKEIDVLNFCFRMRNRRVMMIQLEEQYVFLYKALFEGFLSLDTCFHADAFCVHVTSEKDKPIHQTSFRTQYKNLEKLRHPIDPLLAKGAMNEVNRKKSRSNSVYPADNSRPFLSIPFPDLSDFINAVFVNPYCPNIKGFIVTQYPLINTVIDFWRMIYQHDTNVVLTCDDINAYQCSDPPYFPRSTNALSCGPFTIKLIHISEHKTFTVRKLIAQLKMKGESGEKKVTHISAIPSSTNSLKFACYLDIISYLQGKKNLLSADNYLIVQCFDGFTCSGLFCALYNSIDRIIMDNIVDVFKTVHLLRINRPQFIVNEEQYKELCLLICEYIARKSVRHDYFALL